MISRVKISFCVYCIKHQYLYCLLFFLYGQLYPEALFFYIHIPVGSLTKYPVLQGTGYRIPIKVSLDGVTKTDFQEEFVQSGINQVKNRIYIIVSAKISIISSIMTVSEIVSTEIPVSETIIIGDVPNYYGDKLGVVGR